MHDWMTSKTGAVAEPAEEEEKGQEDKYLTFLIGEECYGLEIRHVTEIIGMHKITAIPDVPEYIKGVINLRGKVIPVMDVRLRFRMPGRDYDDRTCIIVIDVGGNTVGLVVDTVSEVLDIPPRQIDAMTSITDRHCSHFIMSIGKVGEDVKILLDAEKFLSAETETFLGTDEERKSP